MDNHKHHLCTECNSPAIAAGTRTWVTNLNLTTVDPWHSWKDASNQTGKYQIIPCNIILTFLSRLRDCLRGSHFRHCEVRRPHGNSLNYVIVHGLNTLLGPVHAASSRLGHVLSLHHRPEPIKAAPSIRWFLTPRNAVPTPLMSRDLILVLDVVFLHVRIDGAIGSIIAFSFPEAQQTPSTHSRKGHLDRACFEHLVAVLSQRLGQCECSQRRGGG